MASTFPGCTAPSPELVIRRAGLTDLAAIADLEGRCLADPWPPGALAEELAHPLGLALLAEEGTGRTRAYAAFRLGPGEAELMRLAVHPRHRRRGIAGALVTAGLERLVHRGITRCYLEVREGNLAARRLYETLGFHAVGRRRAYYSDGTDALLMTRSLPTPP